MNWKTLTSAVLAAPFFVLTPAFAGNDPEKKTKTDDSQTEKSKTDDTQTDWKTQNAPTPDSPADADKAAADEKKAATPGTTSQGMASSGSNSVDPSMLSKSVKKQVQTELANGGFYAGTVDGIWGPQSKEALRKFQEDRGYNVGLIDADTAEGLKLDMLMIQPVRGTESEALDRGSMEDSSAATGTEGVSSSSGVKRSAVRGPMVSEAQEQLSQLGFDPGPIDGVNGSKTRAALRSFQSSHGLDVSGEMDSATLAKLREEAGGSGSGTSAQPLNLDAADDVGSDKPASPTPAIPRSSPTPNPSSTSPSSDDDSTEDETENNEVAPPATRPEE